MGFIKRVLGFFTRPSHSRTIGIALVLLLGIAVFFTVSLTQQSQTLRQHASGTSCTWDSDCPETTGCVWDHCWFGTCVATSNPALDGRSCNGGSGTCSGGACVTNPTNSGCTSDSQCPSTTGCVWDHCYNGSCVQTSAPWLDGTSCNNGAGKCSGGSCVTVPTPTPTATTTGYCSTSGTTCNDKNGVHKSTCSGSNAVIEYSCVNLLCTANSPKACTSGTSCGYYDPGYAEAGSAYCKASTIPVTTYTCTTNGGTCMSSCSSGYTSVSGTCASGVCCKQSSTPVTTYTCTTNGGTCMSSCSSGYTQTSGTCASGVCCKQSSTPVTTYTCTGSVGTCMSSCSSGYTQTSGTCASGVCCKASTITTSCSVSGNTCTDSTGSYSGSCSTPNGTTYSCSGNSCVSSTLTCSTDQPCTMSSGIPACGTSTNVTLVSALNVQDATFTTDTIDVNLTLYSLTTNNQVSGAPATQAYAKTSIPGRQYSTNVTLTNLASGKYFIIIRKDNMIAKSVFDVSSSGQTITVPTTTLVFGDLDNNNDINIVDYNIFKGCWKQEAAGSCLTSNFIDGGNIVDQIDFNAWLKGLVTWTKQATGV